MKELEYPFDANYLLRKKKSIKKQLLEERSDFTEKRIAVLGGATTNNIVLIMELFLLNNGIRPIFYESEYNKYYEDAMFDPKELVDFHPDIIYICTSIHNLKLKPSVNDTRETVNEKLDAEFHNYCQMWKHLEQTYNCPIIQNNFEKPNYRLLGNRDVYDYRGLTNYVVRLNQKLYEYAEQNDGLYICDIDYLSGDYGLKEWSNAFYYNMYKYALAVSAIPTLAFSVANIVKSIYGKNKKGLVLDLDNTLWGGIVGDDGVDQLMLGTETPEGEAYLAFQQYLKSLSELGIVLNIDSKNDLDNALAGLNHPDSVLHRDDFISVQANWNPKDINFKTIANELNLLPESLVFVDDNPAERFIVQESFSNVSAPEIEDVNLYAEYIDRNGFFEVTNLSDDDKKRNQMYKENAQRKELESSANNYSDYLKSLQMKAEIAPFSPVYMARIAQLTNKSNQFNLTTKRFSLDEIQTIASDKRYITLYGKLTDRFGDNGVVSVVIGEVESDVCHVRLWLMSCRVLKRDMEYAMMDCLVDCCKKQSITKIVGYYYPTAKNGMVKDFYQLQQFEKKAEDDEGNTVWELDLNTYQYKNRFIEVKHES